MPVQGKITVVEHLVLDHLGLAVEQLFLGASVKTDGTGKILLFQDLLQGNSGSNMMRQQQQMQQKLMKMQQEMEKAQADVENSSFTASVGGGVVSATVNGKKMLTDLVIKPEAVDAEDVEMLQDLVVSAVNEALRQADEAMDGAMKGVTGGLNIPGL